GARGGVPAAIGGGRRRMRLPLRLRVTLAFAACMAILLSALGAFVYVRVASDLTNAIDLDLRSRAQVLIGAVHARDPSLVRESHGSLIDPDEAFAQVLDRKSTRLNSSHRTISYAVFCLKKKTTTDKTVRI